jgi:tRNA pseudouridine55 synthase
MTALDGFLVLDKPAGITSRDAVNRVQAWLTKRTHVGHAGTLDPLATGVLVIAIGQATRLVEYVQDMPKTYVSTFLLGARSDTDDADGTITQLKGVAPIELSRIEAVLPQFIGEILQAPPAYSAVKIDGKRAHDLARCGEEVAPRARCVRIDSIQIVHFDWPRLTVEVHCGKGTYIRSIARDLGQALGCGGLVETLRRTRIGQFHVEDAVTLDDQAAPKKLRPMSDAVIELPRVDVTAAEAAQLRQGQAIAGTASGQAAVFCDGELIAIVLGDADKLRPVKVFRVFAPGAQATG